MKESKLGEISSLDYPGLVKLHLNKFGVEPYITGINWNQPDLIEEGIIKAIESGQPYVEEELPPGVNA
mgnify:CR=1 FL=1